MLHPKTSPLSPHLQIYRLPITALVSIGHRICGIISLFGALLLVALLCLAAMGEGGYALAHSQITAWYGIAISTLLFFALYMHLCSGVRHLLYDLGLGMELSSSIKTAWLVPLAACILTIITIFFA